MRDIIENVINDIGKQHCSILLESLYNLITVDRVFYLKTNDNGNINDVPDSIHINGANYSIQHLKGLMTEREQEMLLIMGTYGHTEGDIVEIGSWIGKSTCMLAKSCELRGGNVYAIDPWEYEEHEGIYEQFIENTKEYDNIIPIRGLSRDKVDMIDTSVRLLFIDGDHSAEAVREDIVNYVPLLNSGGTIMLHDYSVSGKGVIEAVNELIVDSGKFKNFVLMDSLFIAEKI